MQELQSIKQRFGIIGNDPGLNRALEKAVRVAATDISVLVVGESGVGKEFIPKIIHSLSKRKHQPYIAVNCGAIPEGTIDSELFGHEKGAFTGATSNRNGYFEVANGGTIFLDEVGELPLATQVRLLRVLETGEFIKVGSSKPQKTDVRVVAATNVNVINAVQEGKFREDLYYRLNTVQIDLPPLRSRAQDIVLLFRKFAADFAERYQMPSVQISDDAKELLVRYNWPGNIRQLRNLVEQLSVMESNRLLNQEQIKQYLPSVHNLPVLYNQNTTNKGTNQSQEYSSDRELIYKFLFDMKKDLNDLRQLTLELVKHSEQDKKTPFNPELVNKVLDSYEIPEIENPSADLPTETARITEPYDFVDYDDVEVSEEQESLSIQQKEKELILKALEKNKGRRKLAAEDLGISERTLYRKIKQFNLQ